MSNELVLAICFRKSYTKRGLKDQFSRASEKKNAYVKMLPEVFHLPNKQIMG